MASKTLLDSNAVLRYLLCDVERQFAEVKKIINSQVCIVTLEVMAEVVYVLERLYQVPRKDICAIIRKFTREIITSNTDILLRALERFEQSPKMDFVDCLMCGYKTARGYEILTFDRTLKKQLETIALPDNGE